MSLWQERARENVFHRSTRRRNGEARVVGSAVVEEGMIGVELHSVKHAQYAQEQHMAITIEQVHTHLESLGKKVNIPEDPARAKFDRILTFATDHYRDTDGDPRIFIVVSVRDEGRYLEIYAPRAYNVRECKYKGALFAAVLQIMYRTKHAQIEYDPSDGEIRFAADMPIMDGTVTAVQIDALMGVMISIADTFHPVLMHVIETGRVDMELAANGEGAPTPPPIPSELAALLEQLGGVEELRKIAEERRKAGS